MRVRPVSFFFRERMQGPLASGIEDPPTGAAQGRVEHTRFVADLTVEIDDLGQCQRDPQHTARLSGSVTFPGLATRQPIRDGRLRMYVSDPVTQTKLMRYELTFRGDQGGEYALDGTKFIHTPGATRHEQVTLYTRIHEGSPTGPVWGAGILTFRLRDLPAFLLSMRAQGASRLQGLRQFLGFARRELATPAGAGTVRGEEVDGAGPASREQGTIRA